MIAQGAPVYKELCEYAGLPYPVWKYLGDQNNMKIRAGNMFCIPNMIQHLMYALCRLQRP
eukprot:632219-Karenia_brevis.AAC.1